MAAITMVNDTNVMAKKSVNVWDDRQSFDGDLQNLIKTIFCWQKFRIEINEQHETMETFNLPLSKILQSF